MKRTSKRQSNRSLIESIESRILLAGNPVVSIGQITSSSVGLNWAPISSASAIRVYLAPEPSASIGAPLPNAVLVSTLSGSATGYQLTNLAPSVDAFLRVEADVPGQTVATNVHAHTAGGPMAALDNAVREVHMMAPNVIEVVLTDNIDNGVGNDGATYQSGSWTVTRRSGSSIGVTNKYRHTAPIGQPEYTLGYGGGVDAANINVDHKIFLVLNQNVGTGEVLTINGPLGVSFKLPFSDKYLETPVIQVNQVGYNPRATERWAYVSGWLGNGGGLSLSSFPSTADVLIQPTDSMSQRTVALDNTPITMRSAFDSESGAPVNQINLASLPAAEGTRYRVQIPGVGVSWPTAISEEAAYKAYYVSARGMYQNRWAGDLRLANTEFSRPQDHVDRPDGTPTVYTGEQANWTQMHPESTPLTGARDVVGGHHDAGDFDIRASHTTIPQLLMRSYELNPTAHTDGQLAIPESGNGIPDLLDEALWNIQGWEALQESDGGVRAGVESWRHPYGYYYAHEEPLAYWTYARDPQVTARAAGVFAQMGYLLRNLDGNTTGTDDTRANQLETRAVNAYNWANNPSHLDYQGDPAAHSYLLYAASELYRLTNNTTYKTAFESHWDALDVWGRGAYDALVADMGYMGDYTDLHRVMQDYTQGYLHASGSKRADIVTVATNELTTNAANSLANQDNDHAHRHPMNGGTLPDWGNSTTPGKYLDTVYGRMSVGGLNATQQQDYFNAMSLAADYVLGCNPMGYTWITGLGSRNPQDVLHLDYLTFLAEGKGVMPGIPVYGPTAGFSTLAYYLPSIDAFYPEIANPSTPTELPLMQRFGDTKTFVTSTEFDTTAVMAPNTELFAALLKPGMTLSNSWKSGGHDFHNPLTNFGAATNRAPVVEAGWPMKTTLPDNDVVLGGQMVDDAFTGSATTTWSKVSGPGTVNFSNASILNATATFSTGGVYVLRLTANDGQASASDDITIEVKDPSKGIFSNGDFEAGIPASGQWPAGYTGVDVSGINVVNNTVGGVGNYVLRVTAGDWKYPALSNAPQRDLAGQKTNTNYELRFKAKFAATTTKTAKVSIIGNTGSAIATMNITGSDTAWHDYTLAFNSGANNRFYVDFTHEGGGGAARDYYLDNVFVTEPAVNLAPTVIAGNDATITLPATANLDGTASDDGNPNPPGALTTTWTKQSGPGTVTFGNASAIDTTATFSQSGTYVLRLTASDSVLQSYDDVTITVNPAPIGGFAWTSENNADANTLALYHFNETSGTTADNAQGSAGRDLTLSSGSMITSGTDFLGRNSYFLNTSFGQATSAAQAIPTDWNSDLTISFWMKTTSQTSGNRSPVMISDGLGWKNEAAFTYNPTFTDPYRPKMANVGTVTGGAPSNIQSALLNGAWHNVAITHRASDDTARLYVDNVLLHTWNDAGGANLAAGAAVYVGNGLSGVNLYVDELLIQKSQITSFANALNPTVPNIFSNGGFESGNLTGWSGDTAGLSVVSNTVGGTGNYVLRVTSGDWKYPAIGNQPQASSGVQQINTDYTLSFDIKWNASTTKMIRAAIIGESGVAIAYVDVGYVDSNWHTYQLNFNSGDIYGNGNEPFYIRFIHEGGGGTARDYYLDNVVVAEA